MEVEVKSTSGTKEIRYINITIGNNRYRVSESIDGKLCINKSDGDDGSLMVFPRTSNEIELK